MDIKSIRWSYEGKQGPEYWANLDNGYRPCGEGRKQSPVDIPLNAPINLDGPIFNYSESRVNIIKFNYSIQANIVAVCTVIIEGRIYALQQIHFHSPSEHTLVGEFFAMEMHLVHAAANGAAAVIGVFLIEGKENLTLDPIWTQLPAMGESNSFVEGISLNVPQLLPEDRGYYRYSGSLTTPPCTQGVVWILLANAIEISADQLAAYRALFHGTNRPVQPMNNRKFR